MVLKFNEYLANTLKKKIESQSTDNGIPMDNEMFFRKGSTLVSQTHSEINKGKPWKKMSLHTLQD